MVYSAQLGSVSRVATRFTPTVHRPRFTLTNGQSLALRVGSSPSNGFNFRLISHQGTYFALQGLSKQIEVTKIANNTLYNGIRLNLVKNQVEGLTGVQFKLDTDAYSIFVETTGHEKIKIVDASAADLAAIDNFLNPLAALEVSSRTIADQSRMEQTLFGISDLGAVLPFNEAPVSAPTPTTFLKDHPDLGKTLLPGNLSIVAHGKSSVFEIAEGESCTLAVDNKFYLISKRGNRYRVTEGGIEITPRGTDQYMFLEPNIVISFNEHGDLILGNMSNHEVIVERIAPRQSTFEV